MSLLNKFRPGQLREPLPQPQSARPGTRGPAAAPLHAAASAATPAREARPGRFSNGLKEFLWQLDGIGRGHLLDLGAVSQGTLNFFIERNFKVYTEDILGTLREFQRSEADLSQRRAPGTPVQDPSVAARAERFLTANMDHPRDSFDAVLLWDVLDYLDRETVTGLMARLSQMVRDGGAIFAIFHTRAAEQFQRYRVLDALNLDLVPVSPIVPFQHVYQNREIDVLFERFRASKTFVGRDQLRESVFVK